MDNMDFDLRSVQEARDLCKYGSVAAERIAKYSEEQIDKILQNMVRVAEEHSAELAQMAVEETGFGKVLDKTYKNHAASTLVYNSIKNMKTQGIISEDPVNKMFEVADPVGLIMGIVPSTNPTSTVIYKSLIAVKARNAIVFSPHPSALKCTSRAARLMAQAAVDAGAPSDTIGCQSMCTIQATNELMHNDAIRLIIATGGPGMVKASYSAGKPAIGVGAGNSPSYIERTANVKEAVSNIIASKTFDNGTICASEQSIIVEECNHDAVVAELKAQGAYFMNSDEIRKVCGVLFKNGHTMNAKYVGRSAKVIADGAGISVPDHTTVLIGAQSGVGEENLLSYEKLTCVLGFYVVRDWHEACELSMRLLQNGIGHTMNLHTQDEKIVREFAVKPASRILVNTGGSMGGTGLSTGLAPAFTLGCGTMGGSSVSENVTPLHLINKKTVCYGIKNAVTMLNDDPTFHSNNTAAVRSQTCSSIPATPISYSTGCNSCGCDAQSPASFVRNPMAAAHAACVAGTQTVSEDIDSRKMASADEGINLEQLKDMINGLVNAMKGE